MRKYFGKILIIGLIVLGGSLLLYRKKWRPTTKSPVNFLTRLDIEELRPGQGTSAKETDLVRIHFNEWVMAGGKLIDSSYQRGVPSDLTLNSVDIIQGLKQGVIGMKPGGKRKLVIPPDLAYGNRSEGMIPPNSHLVFEVELLEILPQAPPADRPGALISPTTNAVPAKKK
jgi:FKBP-type peptidyl-prolyl cis-trans isomerase